MKLGLFALTSALLVVALAGCAGTPTSYYTLAPATPAAQGRAPTADALFIEMAPVAVPERFARAQMVMRKANAPQGKVEVLEQSRWSSSFENELRDTLAAGVADRLGAVDATKSGRTRGQPVYRVAVQVRDFDAVEGQQVDGSFSWTLRRSDEETASACQWRGSEPVSGGAEGVAQGAQRMVARLSDAIAANVASLASGKSASCPA